MSRTYEQLEPVISALDNRISANAEQIATNAEDISQLKSEFVDVEQAVGYEIIELQNNKTINTSGGTNVTPDYMQTENNWCGCCVPCSEGDLFTITGGGGSGTRLWAFANSSGVVLEQADASAYGTNLKKTAPENSAYFAFNSRKSDSPFVYRGTKPVELFDVRPTTEDLKNIVGYTVNNLFDGIGTTSGKYVNANNGKIQDLTSYSVTDFFKVVAGATYKLPYHASGSQIAFYDINKAYVPSSGFVTTSDTFTVPDNNNIVFARWCADTANLASWALYIVPITDLRIKYIDQTEGILAGVIDAYSNGIKKIIVQSGAYDIIAEYEAKYGTDYFNDYADNYNGKVNGKFDCGIWLDNIDISFESGVIVNANYTGNNQYVKSYFSAFAIGQNVTIDGLVLDASELRYGIHPDFHIKQTEKLTIKNCDLHHYKSSNSGVNNNQAIGAGLGVYSIWKIENCIFRSDTSNPVLRIHNNASKNAMSKILIKDCYIIGNGYILLNSYSTSTKQTNASVTGCSWANPAVVGKETPSSNDNITMYAWNNEIRS